MPYPIVNSIISWFLKKRKHQMELFLKYPVDVQEELLSKLLEKAQDTEKCMYIASPFINTIVQEITHHLKI